jgi:hypothetical protein
MAAGSTYTSIATQTLSSEIDTITFSSISGSYTDLVLVSSAKNNQSGNVTFRMRFNSDSSSLYSYARIYGDGTSAASDRSSQSFIDIGSIGGSATSSVFAPSIVNIMNYSNTSTFKTSLVRWQSQGTSAAYVMGEVGLYRSTSAITTITLTAAGANFDTGSTFTLYGIASA